MLLSLLDGRALPAGELAFSANVAPQTASGHLAKPVEGGLLSVENRGRHRYYRLAGPEVGTALEALGEFAPAPRATLSRTTRGQGPLLCENMLQPSGRSIS
jgi:DNA-binding transcriptional ArsR family regulator